jgi:hypothetical protein
MIATSLAGIAASWQAPGGSRADMSDDRQADTTDAGIGRDVGEGYPEEQPAGASPHGESPARSGEAGDAAPQSKPDADADAEQATGNPDAAG